MELLTLYGDIPLWNFLQIVTQIYATTIRIFDPNSEYLFHKLS